MTVRGGGSWFVFLSSYSCARDRVAGFGVDSQPGNALVVMGGLENSENADARSLQNNVRKGEQ